VREVPVGPVDETLARVGRLLREAKDVDLLLYATDVSRAMSVLRTGGFHGRRTPIGAKLRDERTGVDVDLVGTAFAGDERALDATPAPGISSS
jgi:hypothetical protein